LKLESVFTSSESVEKSKLQLRPSYTSISLAKHDSKFLFLYDQSNTDIFDFEKKAIVQTFPRVIKNIHQHGDYFLLENKIYNSEWTPIQDLLTVLTNGHKWEAIQSACSLGPDLLMVGHYWRGAVSFLKFDSVEKKFLSLTSKYPTLSGQTQDEFAVNHYLGRLCYFNEVKNDVYTVWAILRGVQIIRYTFPIT